MTLAPLAIRRSFPLTDRSSEKHLIEVDQQNKVVVCLHRPDLADHTLARSAGQKRLSKSLILIIHGLEGSAESTYVKGVCEKALSLGFSVCRLNLRNCGDTLHLAQGLYNAGMSDDAITVAKHLKEKFGFEQVFLCGFSLGGNIVLKAAGELGRKAAENLAAGSPAKIIDGVCAVCPPVDLQSCVTAIERKTNRLYEHGFLVSLKEKVRAKNLLFPGRFDIERLPAVTTLRGFDDTYTSRDAGYADAASYYHGASALRVMPHINVPALVVAAVDDPLVPIESFRSKEFGANRHVQLLTPEKGGHVAFISNKAISVKDIGGASQHSVLRDRFWSEWQVVHFIFSLVN